MAKTRLSLESNIWIVIVYFLERRPIGKYYNKIAHRNADY